MSDAWLAIWPPTASNTGDAVDWLFIALLGVSVAILVLNYGLLGFFAIKYRAGNPVDRRRPLRKSWVWEAGWTGATLVGFLVLFVWGAGLYLWLYRPPATDDEVFVVGKQWMWKAEHADGTREIDALHLAVGRSVRLVLTSQDVIHSFFIPAFRIKHAVLPGTYETLWVKPTRTGAFRILCAEFCGTEHAHMGGTVYVMDPADYQRWRADQPPSATLAQQGEALYRQLGCSGCHDAGSTVHAPSLAGLYGRPVQLADGRSVIADQRYLHDCILVPRSQPVAGYPPVMPSFAGQIGEDDVLKLVAYIKSLGR